MKNRFLCGAVALCLFISGCSTAPGINPEEADNIDSEPTWSREQLQSFLDREPDAVMAYAGPFYFGSFDGIDKDSSEYSEMRRNKVDEIIGILDSGIEVMVKLDAKLKEERDVLMWYVQGIQEIDPGTKKYTDQVLGATKGSILSEALSNLLVLSRDAANMDEGPAWGFMQFQRYGAFIELTDLYTAESGGIVARATALYYMLEADPNNAYQNLNKEFAAKMDSISDEASELLSEVYYYTSMAAYGEDMLFSADYYFAEGTLKKVDQKIAEARKAFDDYTGTNELLSEEVLVLLEKQLADMESYRDSIQAYLDNFPSDELIPVAELAMMDNGSSIIPVAYAQGFGSPGWFQKKISSAVKTAKFVKDMSFAAVRVAGQKVKEYYDESGAHEVVKDGAQILNGGLEIVNSTVEVTISGLQGIYYGDMSWQDFKRRISQEKKELYDKFVAGKLGKEQYDEIINQVDLFQKNTQRFVEDMSDFSEFVTSVGTGSSKAGKFVKNVTRSVGNEAKGVLDTATNFSKNLAIVMHPETTKQQTREAMLDIYTTLQGLKGEDGKWVEVELPDLKELTKEKALEEAVNELGLNQEEEKEFREQLTELFQNQLKDKETSSKEKKEDKKPDAEKDTGTTEKDPVLEILTNPNLSDQEIRDLLIAEITKELPKDGTKKTDKKEEDNKDGDGDGIENEYDNCEKVANEDQTDTDLDSLGDACDPDCSGDNDGDGVCNEIDNCPEDSNTDQSDNDNDGIGNECDGDAPPLSEIVGQWPGSVTVTDVTISDELRAQAEAEGCDLSQLDENVGKKQPTSIDIVASGDSSGTMKFVGVDGDEQLIPFTYENGVLVGTTTTEDGAVAAIELNFGEKTSEGRLNVDAFEGGVQVEGDMIFER